MKIKEQDLIKLGFKINHETVESSGYPNDWYYYTYDFKGGFSLISCDNEESESNGWYVEIFDYESMKFKTIKEVKQLINLVNNALT